MEFRGNEHATNSVEKMTELETRLEKLNTIYKNLLSGKDASGNNIVGKENKNRAKLEKKDVKRQITELENEINLISIASDEKPEGRQDVKKEKSAENTEIAKEFFGTNMENIDLVTDTMFREAEKTTAVLNSKGEQGLHNIKDANATGEELDNARKAQEEVANEGKNASDELRAELLELTFPVMVPAGGLDKEQSEQKLSEIDNFLKKNNIDLAFEKGQEVQSETEQRYSDEIIAIGEYRKELLQKLESSKIDQQSNNNKITFNEEPAVQKPDNQEVRENKSKSFFDSFDFSIAKSKSDLISLMRRFYASLSEKNIDNEIVADLMLFVNENDASYLESAKMNYEKIRDDEAKNKIWELIAKCEELIKSELARERNGEENKWREISHFYENVKNDFVTRLEEEGTPENERKELIENLRRIASEFDNELLTGFDIKINDENRKKAFDMQKSVCEELIAKYGTIKKEAMEKNAEKGAILEELRAKINALSEGDLHSLRRAMEDNLDEHIIEERYGKENFESLLKGEIDFENIKAFTIKEVKELIESVYEKRKKEQIEDAFGIKIKTRSEIEEMENEELINTGKDVFKKYEELNASKDFGKIKDLPEFKILTEYLNNIYAEHSKRIMEGRIEVPKFTRMPDEDIPNLDIKSLQEELAKTENYLNYIKNHKNREPWFGSEFNDYGLYQQKLENRINEIKSGQEINKQEETLENVIDVREMNIMNDEKIRNEGSVDALQDEIDKTIGYLNNTENLHTEKRSYLSEYIDKLEIRKSQLQKITETAGYKKIKMDVENLNKNLVQIERPSEKEEIENIKKSKNIKELNDSINKINGKNNTNAKNLKSLLEDVFLQVADVKNGKLNENIDLKDFKKIVDAMGKDEIAKSYIDALFGAIENIRIETKNEFKIGDKVCMKEKDGQVREGWIVSKVDGMDIGVRNEKSGDVIKTTYGELNSFQNEKIMENAKKAREKEEEIKLREYELQLSGEDPSKDEKLKQLRNELEGLSESKVEKKEGFKTYGELIDNLKKMQELREKREAEFSRISGNEELQKIKDKAIKGEKLSEKEAAQYKSLFMAKDEVIISDIGISVIQNSNLYQADLSSLSHSEAMKLLDRRIKASKVDILLHETLRSSIHACNEKMYQMDMGRKGIANKIVDGILGKAKNIPIINKLVYPKLGAEAEEGKKKEGSIKEGTIVSVKEKKGTSEGWKIVKVDGENVRLEKESRGAKDVKEKDLMKWNGKNEKGMFKKGDKVKVIRGDGQLDDNWTIEDIKSGKITVMKENVKTEKTVKKKDIIVPEKIADKEGFKELAKELNGLKNNELNLANIRTNLKDMASFDNVSKTLKNKLSRVSQKASYFEELDDKTANDIQNVFNIDLNWYNECIKDKTNQGKSADRDQDKKEFDEMAAKHKNLIKSLPDEFKDFKDGFVNFIEFLSGVYHETKYSDEKGDSEKDKTKETDDLLKKIFNLNQIKAVAESKNAKETLEAIEKIKEELKPKIKDNSVVEACFQILDRITSDAQTNTRIRGYSRDKLKDDIEKIENKNAKEYLNAVLKNIDYLIKNGKDTLENNQRTASKKKKKRVK